MNKSELEKFILDTWDTKNGRYKLAILFAQTLQKREFCDTLLASKEFVAWMRLLDVSDLDAGVRHVLATLLGASTSQLKKVTSKVNGKKGGRPPQFLPDGSVNPKWKPRRIKKPWDDIG